MNNKEATQVISEVVAQLIAIPLERIAAALERIAETGERMSTTFAQLQTDFTNFQTDFAAFVTNVQAALQTIANSGVTAAQQAELNTIDQGLQAMDTTIKGITFLSGAPPPSTGTGTTGPVASSSSLTT